MIRDCIAPVGMVAALFAAALCLVVAGSRPAYRQATADCNLTAEFADRVARIHLAATRSIVAHTAADEIAHNPVERISYRILMELDDPSAAVGVLLHRGRFRRGRTEIVGWAQTADVIFGSRTDRLTDVEIALYCHWVEHGPSAWSPDALVALRAEMIDRLERAGHFDADVAASLRARPLVLQPTPIPID